MMKYRSTIEAIDIAIKTLYSLDPNHKAEDYLIFDKRTHISVPTPNRLGAVYMKESDDYGLEVGIYLSPIIRKELAKLSLEKPTEWTREQFNAFLVASEEISHFNYIISRAQCDVPMTHLEMELQAEIDKFLLSYFTFHSADAFEFLYETLFYRFILPNTLSREDRDRYMLANHLAKNFVYKIRRHLNDKHLLSELRRFYWKSKEEKISLSAIK